MLQFTVPICYATLGGWLIKKDPAHGRAWTLAAMGAVLLSHALLLGSLITVRTAISLSIGELLSLIGFAVALAAIAGTVRAHSKILAGASLLLAALLSAATALGPHQTGTGTMAWPLLAHVIFSIISYALLSIAAVTAGMLYFKHRALKRGALALQSGSKLSIEALENELFGAIGTGFGCLSVAIFSGLIYVEDLFAQHLAHKTVLTFASWVFFGVLLLGRWRFGWRGQTAVRTTLIGFLLLILAYFGSRVVLEVLLHEQWG
ncbi:MAG: cytochrome c biogenesis protein CcsA [Pseudomonadota bacterium]